MKNAVLLLVVVALMGCEQRAAEAPEKSEGPATTSAPQADEGKFSVEIKVSASQGVFQVEGAPGPDVVQAALATAIHHQEAFDAAGPRKLKGTVTYDVRPLPDAAAGFDVLLLGALNSPNANFEAGVNLQSTDEAWKSSTVAEMVDAAIADFAERIGAQGRVMGGDDATLAKILRDRSESVAARLMAIQEVRERRLSSELETVRPYLAAEHDVRLRLAASATLVALGDRESIPQILAVAEDLSRERDPQFVPMLHILGDLGGTEVVTYLEAVSDAHAAPAVRSVAAEALEKARSVRIPDR